MAMDIERIKMRIGDVWSGLGSEDERRRKLMFAGACVVLPLAIGLIIWNMSWMFAGPVELELTPEVVAANQVMNDDMTALAKMSASELEAEVNRRRAAYKAADKAGDAAQTQATYDALERALEAHGEAVSRETAGG